MGKRQTPTFSHSRLASGFLLLSVVPHLADADGATRLRQLQPGSASCICSPLVGGPPAARTIVTYSTSLAASNSSYAVGLGLNGDNLAYFGPAGAVPEPCPSNLEDPREVPNGAALVTIAGGFVQGSDYLFMQPAMSMGPVLYYGSTYNATSGVLTITGITQLARYMLATSNIRFATGPGAAATAAAAGSGQIGRNGNGDANNGSQSQIAESGALVPGLRNITIVFVQPNACRSNTVTTFVNVGSAAQGREASLSAPAFYNGKAASPSPVSSAAPSSAPLAQGPVPSLLPPTAAASDAASVRATSGMASTTCLQAVTLATAAWLAYMGAAPGR